MSRELIYKDQAVRAILKQMPSVAWCINTIKPVEVRPVVHAHWRIEYAYRDMLEGRCSHCNQLLTVATEDNLMPFCCKCGATMDEEPEYLNRKGEYDYGVT